MSNGFQAGGATSRNALKKYLKADDENNFETVMRELKALRNDMKNVVQRLTVIEEKLGVTQNVK